jgi:hypothetical protein
LGNVFFGKEGVKSSEEKPSGEKPNEQPHPKPKPKPIKFHYAYCGRDGHKGEFCFKKRLEEKMAKEGQTRTGTTHLLVCLSLVWHYPGVRPLFA